MKSYKSLSLLYIVQFIWVNTSVAQTYSGTFSNTSSTGYGLYTRGGSASKFALGVYDYSNAMLLQIDGNGQLRLGTENWPTSVLGNISGRHIIGGPSQPMLTLFNESAVAANNESSLILGAKNALGPTFIGGGYLRGAIENNSDGAGSLSFLTSDAFSAFHERMRISGSGFIGIGTVAPAEKLQVTDGRIYANGTGSTSGFTLNNWSMYQTGGSAFNLRYNSSDILTAGPDGNFGFGTAPSSTDKISVNGFIRAKKMIVTQSGWSDYVFEGGYKLRSLSSLDTFIRNNKHLPEIPSAKEVEANGISIGDTQALLLKKIEELTLYLIQLEQKTNRQQMEIDTLKKRK